MKKKDIEIIEQELNIKLPNDYKTYLLKYPPKLKSDCFGPEYNELINIPKVLLDENKTARADYAHKQEC